MFGFLLGLGTGALCMLNRDGTRKLVATVLANGQIAATATAREAARWSSRVGEELEDIVAEARSEREKP